MPASVEPDAGTLLNLRSSVRLAKMVVVIGIDPGSTMYFAPPRASSAVDITVRCGL